MDDIKALLIGICGTLLVMLGSKFYSLYKRKSLRNDLEFLEFEKEHLSAMKKSSIEMNRSSFRAIFALFIFFGFSKLIPIFILIISPSISSLTPYFEFVIWIMFVSLSINFWRRYDKLKNFMKTMSNIDEKIDKIKSRLDKEQQPQAKNLQ